MILREAKKQDKKQIKELYKEAFPKEERAPLFLMNQRAAKGKGTFLIAEENGEFSGFIYVVCYADMAYLFYLAVAKAERGKGYGSKILQEIKKYYNGKRIFLAREQLDETAPNYEQRRQRHAFYLKNGFEDLPYHIKEASVVYDIMGIGGTVSANDYEELIRQWGGKFWQKMIDMRIIEE